MKSSVRGWIKVILMLWGTGSDCRYKWALGPERVLLKALSPLSLLSPCHDPPLKLWNAMQICELILRKIHVITQYSHSFEHVTHPTHILVIRNLFTIPQGRNIISPGLLKEKLRLRNVEWLVPNRVLVDSRQEILTQYYPSSKFMSSNPKTQQIIHT